MINKSKYIIMLIILINSINVYSYINTYKATIDITDRGDGTPIFGEMYETVQIYCFSDRCELVCYQPGTTYECSWEGATWCDNCNEYRNIYISEGGNQLFEYAQEQISNGILTGTYSNNIYREPLGKTIYRTVTWNVDMITLIATIEITISDLQ